MTPTATASRPSPAAAPAQSASRTAAAPLLGFFALAFVSSWAWLVPMALSGQLVRRGDGWPTHLPALFGPLLAALVMLALCEGRVGLRAWLAAMVRWPRAWRWRLTAVSPLGLLAVAVAVVAVTGHVPPANAFISYSGTAASVLVVLVAVALGALGEEAGWRGYALPRLQTRYGPLRGTLLLAGAWALWHTPLFFLLGSYRGFSPLAVPGFVIGLAAGSLVLTSLYNHTDGSILVVAVWHGTYNLTSGTTAADGTIAALATAAVICWAIALLQRERAGRPALGRPPASTPTTPPRTGPGP